MDSDIIDKVTNIKKILHKNGNTIVDHLLDNMDNDKINKLYELFTNDIIFDSHDPIVCYFLGFYHKCDNENYKLSSKYYKISMKGGCIYGLLGLAHTYSVTNKLDKMKKYYLIAIDKNSVEALYFFGKYYYDQQNYENMKKYLTIAVDMNCKYSINILVDYYTNIEINTKVVRMYNNILLTNSSNRIILNGIDIKRLEAYMNFPNMARSNEIINIFNNIVTTKLSNKERIKFLQLVKEYTFDDTEDLHTSLQIILDILK